MRHAGSLTTFRQNTCLCAIILTLILSACSDDRSKNKVQPARTFAAPTKAVAKTEQMSRPIGCNGNPYYYDHETQEWYYYTMDGRAIVSPSQPPCFGADAILAKQNPERRVLGKNDASGDE